MWKELKGFPKYEINENGVVRNRQTHYVTSQRMNRSGYLFVQLLDDHNENHVCLVHRLVAESFIPNPNNLPIVNHIDECCVHNSVDNLEWISYKGNSNHGTRNERIIRDRQIAVIAFDKDGKTVNKFPSKREAARYYCVSEISIRSAISNKNRCKLLYWRPDEGSNPKEEERINKKWIEDSYDKKLTKKQSRRCVPVDAYDSDGTIIYSFSTISEAARIMNVTSPAIASAIKQGTKCCSYYWKEKT